MSRAFINPMWQALRNGYRCEWAGGDIKRVTYHTQGNQIAVTFQDGGWYLYQNIGRDEGHALMSASSIGQFLRENIINSPEKYPAKRLK